MRQMGLEQCKSLLIKFTTERLRKSVNMVSLPKSELLIFLIGATVAGHSGDSAILVLLTTCFT